VATGLSRSGDKVTFRRNLRLIAHSGLLVSFMGSFPQGFGQATGTPQSVQMDRQTFSIAGKDVVLIGGSMHYFRIPSAEWETDFQRMREDGFNIADVYIPWFVHEPEEGKFDFETLQRFLDLAQVRYVCRGQTRSVYQQ
jgi:hypothetical protein